MAWRALLAGGVSLSSTGLHITGVIDSRGLGGGRWKLDKAEDRSRRRLRLKLDYRLHQDDGKGRSVGTAAAGGEEAEKKRCVG
jgi:hypothetical protein